MAQLAASIWDGGFSTWDAGGSIWDRPRPLPPDSRIPDFAAAAQALVDAVLAACTDPGDAIRLLLPLAGYMPTPRPGSGPLARAANGAEAIAAAFLRATACTALARAALAYNPVSYQDAQSVRLLVVGALDAEALRSADAGRDATYAALRELRSAVALDLAVRGASLPLLVEVTTRVPMPSLAEAWALYQDTSREPALVASANPPHPLWLPLEFPALAF